VRDVRVARFGKVGECLVEPVLFSLAAQGVTMAECQDMPVFMGQNVNQVFIGAEMSVEIDHVGLVGQWPRKAGPKVGCSDEAADGGFAVLQMGKSRCEQHSEASIVIDVCRWADQPISTGHDCRFKKVNDQRAELS